VFDNYPLSFPVFDATLTFIFVSLPRFSVRFLRRSIQRNEIQSEDRIPTLIIGAGDAGINVLMDIQRNKGLNLYPIGFIDDDLTKKNLRIRGLKVFGGRNMIEKVVKSYSVKRILIAMPSAPGSEIRQILEIAKNTKAEILNLPGLYEIIHGDVSIQTFKKVEIEDLLRREPFKIDLANIYKLLTNKVVLITGAGGSIGREICRQVMNAHPQKILLLGHGENSIFEIEQELKSDFNHFQDRIIPIIADMRDTQRIEDLFSFHKPQVIFHAAAHKHVPLMESNLVDAITNNVLGIKNILDSAIKYNVESLVYISTDKAVNPPNIMGATKRIAELLLQHRNLNSKLKLITVRFGNVLGSRGSVVHTFRKQIEQGGPVTITDPHIERYFMTIPEAVRLVLQAFSLGTGGEVFVLDMGERVKIVDLAKDMIRLSGFDVEDIGIKYTGLRPGEKLIEELFIKDEVVQRTAHTKIFKAKGIYKNMDDCVKEIDMLIDYACANREHDAKEKLFYIVKNHKDQFEEKELRFRDIVVVQN
jgi:FlaA1/EpsC-like NDP-sugar epimerase